MRKWWHRTKKWTKSSPSLEVVPIVADGAIATRILGDGRLIPVLILDSTNRLDIIDLVRAQQELPPGDVEIKWGKLLKEKDKVILILSFIKPCEALVVLKFDITEHGILIQSILTAKALYLQPGKVGDRLSNSLTNPRMLVEVPDTGFGDEWNKIWPKTLTRKLRRSGLSRKDARHGASTVVSQLRDMAAIRMRGQK